MDNCDEHQGGEKGVSRSFHGKSGGEGELLKCSGDGEFTIIIIIFLNNFNIKIRIHGCRQSVDSSIYRVRCVQALRRQAVQHFSYSRADGSKHVGSGVRVGLFVFFF